MRMQIFHDRKADQITLVQPGHPISAWGVYVPSAAVMAVAAVFAWMEEGLVAKVLAIVCLAAVAVLLRLAVWALTGTVASFDGETRILTIRRTRPWGTSRDTVAFADVFDVVTTEFSLIVYQEYRMDIVFADERTLRLRSTGANDVEDALLELRLMIRR